MTQPTQEQLTRLLISLLEFQLRTGCGQFDCNPMLCATSRKQCTQRPAREFSAASARALAFSLATLPNSESFLCQRTVEKFLPNKLEEKTEDIEAVITNVRNVLSDHDGRIKHTQSASTGLRSDPRNFAQLLFNSKRIESFSSANFVSRSHGKSALVRADTDLRDAQQLYRTDATVGLYVASIVRGLQTLKNWESSPIANREWIEESTARCLAGSIAKALTQAWISASDGDILDSTVCRACRFACESWRSGSASLANCFLHAWNGESLIKWDSAAGHALRCLTFRSFQWDAEGLRGVAGAGQRTVDLRQAISNSITNPLRLVHAWFDLEGDTERQKDTVCITSFPALLDDAIQVTLFRGICFYRTSGSIDIPRLYRKMVDKPFVALASAGAIWPPAVTGLANGALLNAFNKFLSIEVRRDHLLEDAFSQLWRRQERELLLPIRVDIRSQVEMGVDHGGVSQEFFRLAMIEAFKPEYGLFIIDETTRMAWFDHRSLEPEFKFEILGMIMALAIHNGFTLPVTFPMALYLKLNERIVSRIDQIEDGWPQLASGLKRLQDWDTAEDGEIEEAFGTTYEYSYKTFEGNLVELDMSKDVPDSKDTARSRQKAPVVTESNRHTYIHDYIDYLANKLVFKQFSAFEQGFRRVLPFNLIRTVTPKTLQRIAEGQSQEISTLALERVTHFVGYSRHDPYMQTFWSIVHAFPQLRKRQLLEFVTASDRIPVNGYEGVQFLVQKHGSEDRLPTSQTCFGVLMLPEYGNAETLQRMLEIALDNARGFGLS